MGIVLSMSGLLSVLCYWPKCWPLESLKRVEEFPPNLFRALLAELLAFRPQERSA
jgi:hypothetical protein